MVPHHRRFPPFPKSEPSNTLTPSPRTQVPGAELENPRLPPFSRLKGRGNSGGPRAGGSGRAARPQPGQSARRDGATAGATARGRPRGRAVRAPRVLSAQPGRTRRLRTPRCPAPLREAWLRVRGRPDRTRPATVTGPTPRSTPARAAHPPAAHLLGVRVRGQARLQLLHNLERRLRRHRCHWRGLLAGTGLASRPRAATPPSVRPRRRRKREWSLPGLRWGACGDGLRTRPRARPRPQRLRRPPCCCPGGRPRPRQPSPQPRSQPRPRCPGPRQGSRFCKPSFGLYAHAPSSPVGREPHPRLHLTEASMLGRQRTPRPSWDTWSGRRELTPSRL